MNPPTKTKTRKGRPPKYARGSTKRVSTRIACAVLAAWSKQGGKDLSADIAAAFEQKYLPK